MKLTKPSTGEKVTIREFLRQWKEGMQHITPLQQTYSAMFGQIVSAIGVIWGIVFSVKLRYWWMMTILIGGIIVLGSQMLGTWQRLEVLKNIEKMIKVSQSEVQLNRRGGKKCLGMNLLTAK